MPKVTSSRRKPTTKVSRKAQAAMTQMPILNQLQEMARDHANRDDRPFEPKTKAQGAYRLSMDSNTLTFGVGPAGTGKTYVAVAVACEAFLAGEIDKMIFTRPVIEAGERLGFLPGEKEDKTAPAFAPIRIELEKRLGKGPVEAMIKSEKIVFIPLAYMRGHSFNKAFVVLDEAQNTTVGQMHLLLTRIGENTRVVIDGDLKQCDLPNFTPSGLADAMKRLSGKPDVGVVQFEVDDIVRSGFCRMIIEAYRDD